MGSVKNETRSYAELVGKPVSEVRAAIRSGAYSGHTAGLARGYLQTNLAILPLRYAADFEAYCRRNPGPCPLVGKSLPGDPRGHELGDIDLRYDVPGYNIYRRGELVETVNSIEAFWREDMVAFALGCSFTFEHALTAAGIGLRHIEEGKTVPMYRTSIQTKQSGPFGGGMVVSMRPIERERLDEVIAITIAYPHAHGAPVHSGDPELIGIKDLARPDWGHPVTIRNGEVPVFWACGVTPQNALQEARPEICITHAPGHMLITDIGEAAGIEALTGG
jgi:uncharacterized protein YcsI (UPF0317 family)